MTAARGCEQHHPCQQKLRPRTRKERGSFLRYPPCPAARGGNRSPWPPGKRNAPWRTKFLHRLKSYSSTYDLGCWRREVGRHAHSRNVRVRWRLSALRSRSRPHPPAPPPSPDFQPPDHAHLVVATIRGLRFRRSIVVHRQRRPEAVCGALTGNRKVDGITPEIVYASPHGIQKLG